jgi:Sulfate permease family
VGHHGAIGAIDELPPAPDHRFTLRERLRGYRLPIGLNPSLRHYRRAWLATDAAAGVTVGALTIPSALGYAEVAGLPPVYGLYAAMVPMVVFALVGSSRHLVLGPDGAFAALIGATLAPLAAGNEARAVTLAPVLAFLVGGLFLVFGLARVGFLANFLSRPLLSGFMTGLAITILVGQLPKLLGLSVDADTTISKLVETVRELGDTELLSLVLGGTTVVLSLVIGRLQPRLPAAVLLLLIGAGLVAVFALEKKGVALVGDIPTGLPPLDVPDVTLSDVRQMFPGPWPSPCSGSPTPCCSLVAMPSRLATASIPTVTSWGSVWPTWPARSPAATRSAPAPPAPGPPSPAAAAGRSCPSWVPSSSPWCC